VSLVHNLQTIYTKVEGTWKSENEINNCDPLTTLISTLAFSTVMITDQTSEEIESVPKIYQRFGGAHPFLFGRNDPMW